MQIRKVLNSSVVLAVDDSGEESILLGKGIGYGRKAGEPIAIQPSDRVFIPLSNPDAKPMMELFASIPPEYLDLTQEIVQDAQQELGEELSPHIYLTLTDHLHFAVQRMQQGIVVTNRVMWEIKNFYRREYAIGQRALRLVQERLGVTLPAEEAANIAFHVVNAHQSEASQYDAMQAAQLIGQVTRIVGYTTGNRFDTESLHYSRFINHLQFFVERFFSGNLLDSKDDFLYQQMLTAYPDAMACAEKVRTFILRNRNVALLNEEVAYLALHIARLTLNEG